MLYCIGCELIRSPRRRCAEAVRAAAGPHYAAPAEMFSCPIAKRSLGRLPLTRRSFVILTACILTATPSGSLALQPVAPRRPRAARVGRGVGVGAGVLHTSHHHSLGVAKSSRSRRHLRRGRARRESAPRGGKIGKSERNCEVRRQFRRRDVIQCEERVTAARAGRAGRRAAPDGGNRN
ncbi:hypothetical protein EVAR_78376_1 [Eumeta japonica]|uniref:Uncharacterized protein n=1 Tax=Eumeta variegata TaxID=151549 RepID=A0A4C1T614_EUMVA|nr:hypothetical protein EVAR_78376_1 [Eumeta japonica]